MPNILVNNNFYQGTADACIIDITPPTFAGISSLVVQSRGQFRASWSAASDPTTPIRYQIYAQANTPTGLFTNPNNVVGITDALQYDFWTLRDGSFLVNGTTYYVGVRALDGVSNMDSNLVTLNAISTGVFVSSDFYEVQGAFVLGLNNQFQGTMWILKNSVLGTGATLGTASYQVYDKTGAAVIGMGQTGIVADANGQFKITPVTSSLNQSLDHYVVKVDITMDSQVRTGYVPMLQPVPEYEIDGVFGLNESNELVGTFWSTADEQIINNPSRLGTASYVIYDRTGAPVGMTESGITADAQGLFEITPIASLLSTDLTFYSVKVSITVDGVTRSEFLSITGKTPAYECYGIFSINALNQLQGTLHAEVDGKVKKGSGLGTASYTVYDATGVAVAGLTQTGIAADANGRFIITPVLATLLTDLTHYSVTIKIFVDGVERESMMGFNLLGT